MIIMRYSIAKSTALILEALNSLCIENKLQVLTIKLIEEFLLVRMIKATLFHKINIFFLQFSSIKIESY